MVDPDQTQETPEGGEGTVPQPNEPEGKEPQTAPVEAVIAERKKRQEAQSELESTRKELETTRAALEQARQSAPKPDEGGLDQVQQKQLQELLADKRQRELSRELGLGDQQTAAVMKTMSDHPTLNPAQAYDLAKAADPDVFKQQEGSSFDPSMHGSLSPTRGGPPEPPSEDDSDERMARIKELQTKDQLQADGLRNNMIGHLAARAMGLPHRKIPI